MGNSLARAARCVAAFLCALTVIVVPAGSAYAITSLDVRVEAGSDDAEEAISTGNVSLGSSDLELTFDSPDEQVVGMRFNGVSIPPGAQIGQAYLQFKVDQTSSDPTSLTIHAQAADNPAGFSNTNFDLTTRPMTLESVSWSPPAWDTVGEEGPNQRTPDLSSVLQEIVDRPGWSNGNSIVVLISGTGTRTAESFNGDAAGAPLLHVEYQPPGTSNEPPTADFGASCTGLACDFTDLSTDDVAITSWLWDFGDGETSTEQNPTHFYSAEGTYNVTLQVGDAAGEIDSTSSDVVVTDPATNTSGIPFGPTKLAESEYGGLYNGTKLTMSPDDILPTLQTARSAGMRIFLILVGSQSNYQNPDGTFNLDLWKAQVDQFAAIDFSSYIDDGTIVAHQLIEEAKAPNQFGGQVITNDVLDEMAQYSKQLWPDMLTVVRVEPTKLADHAAGHDQPWPGGWTWTHLDASWAQYSSSDGDAASYASSQQASADLQDLGLVLGLNVLDGGDGSSGEASPTLPGAWTMSAAELESYGTDLMQTAQGCGFMMWRYETPGSSLEDFFYFRRPDIQSAVSTLADIAAASTEVPCERAGSAPDVVRVRVASDSDDAEQRANGNMILTSSDLELVFDNSNHQIVGVRFAGVTVPAGATITGAHLEFRVDEVDTGPMSLIIQGEATDDATTFTGTNGDISSRTLTAAAVSWDPPAWNTVGESGPDQQSTDIAAVVQEIVDRPGWASGNAMAIVVSGTGERTADSHDGSAENAPLLHIEYQTGAVSNDPPVANDDSATTSEDVPVDTDVIANDTDADGNLDPSTVTIDTPANDGIAASNGDGTVMYTPNADFNGTDTYIYEVCDTGGLCDTATVTVTVNPIDDVPIANDDSSNTDEDLAVNIDVLGNDTDIDSPSLSVTGLTQPANGTAVVGADDTITYTPDPNYNGTDTFTYTAYDGTSSSTPATVTVTVVPVADPPVADDDSAATSEDTPVDVDVLGDDSDPDGDLDPSTLQVTVDPSNGTTSVNPDDTINYTPDPGTSGTDTFTYQICDTTALCDTAVVTVDIGAVNDPPTANDDTDTTTEDNPTDTNVLGNDTDPDDGLDPTTLQVTTPASNGSAVIQPDDTITFTPDANYNGTDTYIYEVCDNGGLCDTATVTITITPVADPPVASDDSATTPENTPVNIDVTANDTDIDGNLDPTTVTIAVQGTKGTATPVGDGTINYTPNPGQTGPDTFTYQTCDTTTLCDTATVTVDIGAVNDPPTANDDSVTTDEDTPALFDPVANDTDPDDGIDRTSTNTDCAGCSTPGNGSLTKHGDGTFTYTPGADFNGGDWFTYEVCDVGGLCDTATVTVTVAPVSDPPVADDDSATTSEDTPVDVDVLGNDSDPDGDLDPTTLQVTVDPSNGTTSVNPDDTINYTPDPGTSGSDSFTYQICDTTALCDTAVVTVDIGAVNDPPTANDDSATTPEDTPTNTNVLGNDTDPDDGLDPTTLQVSTPPSNGSAVIQPDDTITYTPDPNYNGTDTYIYEVCDTGGLCDTATVTITITPVADPPVASDDSATTPEDTPVNIDVSANDTDLDGNLDPTTVSVTVQGTKGTATPVGDGTVTYTPNPGQTGSDTFTYQTCDTTTLCDTAVVTVTVTSSQVTIDQFAVSETTIEGNVTGSLSDTLSSDDVYEEITEVHSGGPPRNRQSFAEHQWTFNIQRGDAIELTAVAYHTPNGESDDFLFEYSYDGGATFEPLFTVTATGPPGSSTAPLREVISGEVIVRVVDTDTTPGNGDTDTLYVDMLVIRTTNPQAPLPTVTVTATDDTAAESGDSGTFVIHRDDSSGSLTVDFTLEGTADEVDDYAALGSSVSFVDGQSDAILVVVPVDDGVAEGDESVELSLDAGTTYQRGAASDATVTILDNNVAGSEARALSESTQSGSVVSGNYASTHFANDLDSETIAEELYAGNKRSRLEHTWTFDVAAGSTVTFHLLANHVGAETFTFAYSTDGGSSWTAINVAPSGSPDSDTLLDSPQGTILVRVTDDDQSRNETTIDQVIIDEMYFLSSP